MLHKLAGSPECMSGRDRNMSTHFAHGNSFRGKLWGNRIKVEPSRFSLCILSYVQHMRTAYHRVGGSWWWSDVAKLSVNYVYWVLPLLLPIDGNLIKDDDDGYQFELPTFTINIDSMWVF